MKLLIEGEEMELMPGTVVALTLQTNDITKPDTIQSNYSNVFSLPDSLSNQARLGFAGEVNTLTDIPYKKLDAQVYSRGMEVVPYGKGQLVEYVRKERIDLQVLSGNRNLFDVIEGLSIRDLDLSQFNHQWNSTIVIDSRTHQWESGYVYDIVNRGIEGQVNASKWIHMYPSTFARIIWDRIFIEAGFVYNWPTMPELFNLLLLTPGEPFGYGEKFIKSRSSKAIVNPTREIAKTHTNVVGEDLQENLIFNDDSSTNLVYDGDANNYDELSGTYIADSYMFLNLQVNVRFDLEVIVGQVKAKIFLYKNGVEFAITERFFNSGLTGKNLPNYIYNHVFERVLVEPGDQFKLRIEITGDSSIFSFKTKLYLDEGSFFQVDVLEEFPPNGQVVLADWLPDISQKDFIKAFKNIFDLTFQTDNHTDLVHIGGFSELLTNLPLAKDWSGKLNLLAKPRQKYLYGSFAQVNFIKWKAESNDSVPESFGNGSILVDNKHLDATKTIIELPFAATFSPSGVPFIPLFKAKEGTIPVEYDPVKSVARLLVRQNVPISYDYLDEEGNTLTVSDLDGRPISRFFPDLDMATGILPTYYSALQALLYQSRFIVVEMLLSEQDIVTMDFLTPVYVDYFKAHFYCNKIIQWQSGYTPCEVELVRI